MTYAPPTDWTSAWQRFLAFSMAQYGLSSPELAIEALRRQLDGLLERIRHDMPDEIAAPLVACVQQACDHLDAGRGPDAFAALHQLASQFGIDPSSLGVRGPRR